MYPGKRSENIIPENPFGKIHLPVQPESQRMGECLESPFQKMHLTVWPMNSSSGIGKQLNVFQQ